MSLLGDSGRAATPTGRMFLLGVLAITCARPAPTQCQRGKLGGADGAAGDNFASALTVDPPWLAVGIRGHDENGRESGAVRVFRRESGEWRADTKLCAADGGPEEWFGYAVDARGARIVVGAPYDGDLGPNSGSAYVFEADQKGAWLEVVKLLPDDGRDYDLFGSAVAIGGEVVLVGAPEDDDLGAASGAGYLFGRDPNGVWDQTAKLLPSDGHGAMLFGQALTLDGDLLIVGAPYDNDQGSYSGSAYVFERGGGGTWQQAGKLLASDGGPLRGYAYAVAISEPGVAIVGSMDAHGNEDHTGAAYVYERDPNGAWSEVAKLTANDGQIGDSFGNAVGIDSNLAVIGAPGDRDSGGNSGSAYVFVRDLSGSWTQAGKVIAADGARQDRFGSAVSVSGSTAIIGAYLDDDQGEDSGSAYIFAVGPDEDGNGVMDVCECIGDLDGDYQIDTVDLLQLLRNYGTTAGATYEDGDLDRDGDVDLADLAALLGTYGTECW